MKRPQFVINFVIIDQGPAIKVKIGEGIGYLLLDTCNKHNFLSTSFFEQYGNENVVVPCEESEVGKTLCDLTIRDYKFRVPMLIKQLDAPDIIGILGRKFLSRWKMIIDFDAEMLYSYYTE